MRTAIVSDLHLGSVQRRGPPARRRDPAHPARGDLPAPSASSCSATRSSCESCPWRPRLRPPGPSSWSSARRWPVREVVLVPGNHDHRLAEPLLERARLDSGGAARPRAAPSPGRRGPPPQIAAWLGAGNPEHRLPGDLAPRGRLRHPRSLHGLPHEPAASRVRRRGGGDAGPWPASRSGRARGLRARPAPDLRTLRFGVAQGASGARARDAEQPLRERLAADLGGDRRRGRAPPPRHARRSRRPASRSSVWRPQPSAARANLRPTSRSAAITRSRGRGRARDGAAAGDRRRPRDHRPHPPRRAPHRGRALVAARRWPAPQHRQLDLRLGLPPPRHAAGALLAGDAHLGRGGRAAAPGAAARPARSREELRAKVGATRWPNSIQAASPPLGDQAACRSRSPASSWRKCEASSIGRGGGKSEPLGDPLADREGQDRVGVGPEHQGRALVLAQRLGDPFALRGAGRVGLGRQDQREGAGAGL